MSFLVHPLYHFHLFIFNFCFRGIVLFLLVFVNLSLGFIPRKCQLDLPQYCSCRYRSSSTRTTVTCRNNMTKVLAFSSQMSQKINIHTLDLSHNLISSIPSTFCEYCEGLTRLDLSHNRITRIHQHAFIKSSVRRLEFLDLSYNNIALKDSLFTNGLAALKYTRHLKTDTWS